jgi:hypothetical protein
LARNISNENVSSLGALREEEKDTLSQKIEGAAGVKA